MLRGLGGRGKIHEITTIIACQQHGLPLLNYHNARARISNGHLGRRRRPVRERHKGHTSKVTNRLKPSH